jgi:hypothetical protein
MKIIITESQYNRLLLNEDKEPKFNFDSDTILGFAKLIGLPLRGQNKFLADKTIENKDVLSKIHTVMTSAEIKQNMIDDLENKGMGGADKKLHDNIETIVLNFNKHSKDKQLNLDTVLNQILRK